MQPDHIDNIRPRWRRVLLVLLLVAAALLALAVLRSGWGPARPEFHATSYEPVAAAPGFTLTSHTGSELSLADLEGRTVFLFFGYTHCPDVCPLTLSQLREALSAAGAEPEDARVLLVTVDPARDTPDVLARYVASFGPAFTGLTGTTAVLDSLYRAYGVHATAEHADSSMVMHTSAIFGIDRHGKLRVLLRPDVPREDFHEDVATLLGI